MKRILMIAAVGMAFASPAWAACPDGQQAYYTSSGGPTPTAVEHCRKVYDHGGDVAWTGNLDKHLTPVMVDDDSNPLTPAVPLVIDGKPIVTASGASDGDHQHDEPFVKGINGVAIGDGAHVGYWVQATETTPGHYVYVDNGTALGAGAAVTHEGSTAIGAGAKSTDANQVTIGTKKETIRAEGITSQTSKDRQIGSLEVVTSDSGGRLATDGGAIFSRLDSQSALLSQHSATLEEHEKGLAIAMAMPDAWLSDKKHFGIFGSVGGFGGETALGLAAIGRLNETWSVNGKLGSDMDFDQFGWQVGFGAQW